MYIMSNKRYVFTTPGSDTIYNEIPLEPIKFYQICGFPNPKTRKFEIREVLIDGDNNIKTYRKINVDETVHKKLLNALRDNKYRLYSTFNLDNIDLPSCNDITLARSDMINMDNDYTGYAKFNGGQDFNWRGSIRTKETI